MSLREIVRVLGGDLYDGGRRANVPAPNHSRADRSVSLLLQGDRVVVHSFGGGDWRDVLDDLRRRRLIDDDNDLQSGRGRLGASRTLTELERRAAALALWDAGRPVSGALSETYCRSRAIGRELPGPWALRHSSDTPVSAYRPGRHRRPAFLAGIQDAAGAYTGVEVTYLTQGGRRADDLRLPRKTVGLAPAGARCGWIPWPRTCWSAKASPPPCRPPSASACRAGRCSRPATCGPGVRRRAAPVLIAADRGADGEASAARLRQRLLADGVAAAIELPPLPFGDWNDWAQGR